MSTAAERAERPPKQPTQAELSGEAAEKLCSRCQAAPASGKHDWCKACNAAYQREYTGTVVDVAERRGFQKGMKAMRQHLAAEFLKAPPGGMMRAGEVAAFISNFEAPPSDQIA